MILKRIFQLYQGLRLELWMPRGVGLGYYNNNVIRIDVESCIKSLYAVVCHEIGHAVFNLKHDETCPLMASGKFKINPHKCSKEDAIKVLKSANNG